MPKQTEQYKLGYYVEGERTDSITEERRFLTLDAQLRGLYSILGNGVIFGWTFKTSANGAMTVSVTQGNGIIGFVSTESISDTDLVLFPNSVNYVSANLTNTSYWDKSVTFSTSLSSTVLDNSIPLGSVLTDGTKIVSFDTSARVEISLVQTIQQLVKNHRHIGGEDNPSLIDLSANVQGVLSQGNIPDLDASIITTGVLDPTRIPKIDHISGLQNQGVLTHSQLDSFVEQLSTLGKTVMGETALVNLLQLVLALKHQWPEVDEFLVNEIALIPGVSPDSFIDFDNTTANVDTRTYQEGGEHQISGTAGPAYKVFSKTWDSEEEPNYPSSSEMDL